MTGDNLRRSGPVVQVSRSALRANLRRCALTTPSSAVDVRADAYGHGAELVVRAAEELGLGVGLAGVPGERTLMDPREVFGLTGRDAGGEPVMRMSGVVLSVKPLRAGEGVSYGFAHRAPGDTRIALVTGGYAQGVFRELGNRVDVTIDGARHRVVGRVAMDVCVVDVGAAQIERGAAAVFFGDARRGEPELAEWVAACGLDPLELTAACGGLAGREVTP